MSIDFDSELQGNVVFFAIETVQLPLLLCSMNPLKFLCAVIVIRHISSKLSNPVSDESCD